MKISLHRTIELSIPTSCSQDPEVKAINDKERFCCTNNRRRRLFLIPGFILSFILFPTFHCYAQQFLNCKKASFDTYIYKLSPADAKDVFTGEKNNLVHYCKTVLDSFPSDSVYTKKLPLGYYVFMNVQENKVNYKLKAYTALQIKVNSFSKKRALVVFDKNGTIRTDVAVHMNKKRIPLHAATQSFNFFYKKEEGLITIHAPEGDFYFDYTDDSYDDENDKTVGEQIKATKVYCYSAYAVQSVKRQLYRVGGFLTGKNRESYAGYMAFNKPKYLPGDTVKMKSFIVHSSGRPIAKTFKLYLSESYNSEKRKLLATLKPVRKGNYAYEFVLPDSLTTGRNYQLIFEKNSRRFMNGSFHLEDYQLDETSYKFHSDKSTYFSGEPIQLYLKGTDANGLPLMDASVKLTAIAESIIALEPTPVFVPYQVWEHEQKLDNLGETKITFPDSLIPRINMSIRIKAIFNNSNNETHEESQVLTIKRVKQEINVKTEGPYILADYLENNQPVEKEGRFSGRFGDDTFFDRKIKFPFKEKINPLISNCIFSVADLREYKSFGSKDAPPGFEGLRTADSVFLTLYNPHQLKVSYTIFRNKEKIAEGNTDTLHWNRADRTAASYYVAYSYVWGGKMYSERFVLHVYEKNLNVNIEQPSEIYPGQQVPVKIKVTDYKNNPVADVNLTAAAINSQFKHFEIPDVPYLGKYKKYTVPGERKHGYREIDNDDIEISDIYEVHTDSISPAILKRTGIDSLLYYQFFYPTQGAHYHYDSVLFTTAQFSPFIVKSGKIINPWMIYLDDRFIYSIESEAKKEYAFIAAPGYHSIRVRTRDQEYRIDSVLLKTGWKLDFSIDADHLPEHVTVKQMTTKYTAEEDRLLRSSLLLLKNNYYGARSFIWQGSNIWELDNRRNGTITVGPLNWDNVHFVSNGRYETEFILEPDYEYTLSKKTHKLVSLIKDYKTLQYSYPQTIYPGDTAFTKNDIPPDYMPPRMNVSFSDPNKIYTGSGGYHFKYRSDSMVHAIKFFPCDSLFATGFYKGNTNTFNHLHKGCYTLMLITENGSLFKKDSIHIREGGTVYEDLGDIQFRPFDNTILFEKTAIDTSSTVVIRTVNVLDSYYTAAGLPGTLRGVIRDAKTEETIPFAAVALLVNEKVVAGSFTDINGNYSFPSLRAGTYTLTATYIGYDPIEKHNLSISKGVFTLNLEFTSSQFFLQEVVVTALGITRSQKSLGYSTSVVSSNYISALQGKAAGVVIRGSSNMDPILIPHVSMPPVLDTFNSDAYKNAKQLRDRFSDYAYWQPNLFTDKKGEIVFNAEFPDNITQWTAYALAMDGKKHSGRGYTQTRAFKKLTATLSVPRFLIEGDESNAVGKSLNYTSSSLQIKSLFKLNDISTIEKSTLVKDAWIEKTLVKAENTDTLTIGYNLQLADGFKDGEQEKIPVFPIGVEETMGSFNTLKKDTAFTLTLDTMRSYQLYAQDNALQMMLQELEKLEQYPYFCNEQTASKINGLLMEKKIRQQLGEKTNPDKDQLIIKLIQKLEKAQYANGSWGWWPQSPSNTWMTAYIAMALYKANNAGYPTTKTAAAIAFLKEQLDVQKGHTLVYTLNVLSEMKQTASFAASMLRLKTDSLSLYDKLMVIKIKQEQQVSYDTALLKKQLRTDIMGNVYIGKESTDWYDNSIQLSLLAYKIFAKDPKMKFYQEGICNYFLQEKRNGGWRNTLETASILETILPDMLDKNDKQIKPAELQLSGNQFHVSVKTFPFHTTIPKSVTSLKISKTGSYPVYFTTYTKYWNKQPEKVNGNFEVQTIFMQDNHQVETLKAGTPTELVVTINVKKEAEYVMIEVPIPAGCSYGPKSVYYYERESNREYLKNRTLIFCEKLSAGSHQFTIHLQPRFTGKYTLNPAKAEMMYFPTFYGREEIKKTTITD